MSLVPALPGRALLLVVGLTAASAGLTGCEYFQSGSSGGGGDGGGDAGGGDAGGSGDGGTDELDCDNPPAPDDVAGPDCLTGTISCNETILGTTQGGSDVFDGQGYGAWFCSPVESSEYTGSERVYAWEHPGDGNATISLYTPCDDLDLFAIYWEDDSVCPIPKYSIAECEGDVGSGADREFVIWNNEPRRYLLVVDGPAGEEAPFELSVTCK